MIIDERFSVNLTPRSFVLVPACGQKPDDCYNLLVINGLRETIRRSGAAVRLSGSVDSPIIHRLSLHCSYGCSVDRMSNSTTFRPGADSGASGLCLHSGFIPWPGGHSRSPAQSFSDRFLLSVAARSCAPVFRAWGPGVPMRSPGIEQPPHDIRPEGSGRDIRGCVVRIKSFVAGFSTLDGQRGGPSRRKR